MTPDPFTPADCDLQDFAFMPLDVQRLRDSDLASDESPEACWAAVLLWAASWHQIPAASIPDNENWIAKHAGYAQRGKIAREWAGVRPGALRGWVKCSDGRLYHPVVAEKAREAWLAKNKQRWYTECSRIKKHNQRHETSIHIPDFEEWLSLGCPQGQPLLVPRDKAANDEDKCRDNGSNRQGEGQGQGQGQTNSVPIGTGGEPPGTPRPPDPPPPKPRKAETPADEEKSRIWRELKLLMVEQETCNDVKAAGILLGKASAKYGNDVFLDAARVTAAARPVHAHTYLIALCEKAAGKRLPLNRQEALEAENRSVAERFIAGREAANAS